MSSAGGWFQQALASHRQGQLAKAQSLYERVLGVRPRHFGAAHMLGVLLYQCRLLQQGWRQVC